MRLRRFFLFFMGISSFLVILALNVEQFPVSASQGHQFLMGSALGKARRRIEYAKHERSNGNIIVKQEYNNITIPLNDIIYVEAMEGYSKIFRTGGVCTVSRVILKSIGAMLPANKFVRIHRSYIVAVDKITGFTRQNVTLESGVTLPVGRQYSAVITQLLNKH